MMNQPRDRFGRYTATSIPMPNFPPDSKYWERRAKSEYWICNETISDDELFNELIDLLWPGDSINERNWQEIAEGYLDICAAGRMIHTMEEMRDHADQLETWECARR